MKYMNQRVFDVLGMRVLITTVTGKGVTDIYNLIEEYRTIFDGDTCFLDQAGQLADHFIKEWSNLTVSEQIALATKVTMVRSELDDDMHKRSTLAKIFSGPMLIKSHQNVDSRVQIAIDNIRLIQKMI